MLLRRRRETRVTSVGRRPRLIPGPARHPVCVCFAFFFFRGPLFAIDQLFAIMNIFDVADGRLFSIWYLPGLRSCAILRIPRLPGPAPEVGGGV